MWVTFGVVVVPRFPPKDVLYPLRIILHQLGPVGSRRFIPRQLLKSTYRLLLMSCTAKRHLKSTDNGGELFLRISEKSANCIYAFLLPLNYISAASNVVAFQPEGKLMPFRSFFKGTKCTSTALKILLDCFINVIASVFQFLCWRESMKSASLIEGLPIIILIVLVVLLCLLTGSSVYPHTSCITHDFPVSFIY